MKRQIKRAAEGVVASLAPLVWRMQPGPRLLTLMYHRVLPPDHPGRAIEQPGMYVSPRTLELHVGLLKRHFELVHLDDWMARADAGSPLPRQACALTFDDGWRDNYDYAYPILRKHGVPATIYLVSDLVGTRYSFWPNDLARALWKCDEAMLARMPDWLCLLAHDPVRGPGLRPFGVERIDGVINACKASRTDAEMVAIVRALEPRQSVDSDADRDLMTWAEIREMQSSGLIRFGSHTRRHTRLSGVSDPGTLADEIVGSSEVIARQLGAAPRTFCYPNGDTSDAAIRMVRSAYQAAVTTRAGWCTPGQDRFLIPRVGVHEDVSNRAAGLLARVSTWLG